ncbi:hypothetical protein H6G64_16580 [Calothrix sp. FACHB-156]|nr:hypothetical protein [Calothrix sp. FACHB-156]
MMFQYKIQLYLQDDFLLTVVGDRIIGFVMNAEALTLSDAQLLPWGVEC